MKWLKSAGIHSVRTEQSAHNPIQKSAFRAKLHDLSNAVYFLFAGSCLVWIVVTYAPSIIFSSVAVMLAIVYFAAATTFLKFFFQREFASPSLANGLSRTTRWTIRIVGLCLPAPAIFYCLYFSYSILAWYALPMEGTGEQLPIDERLSFLARQSAQRLPVDRRLLFLASQEEGIFGKSVVYDYLASKESKSTASDADSQCDTENSAQIREQSTDGKNVRPATSVSNAATLYMNNVQQKIRKYWSPPSIPHSSRGIVCFHLHPDGTLGTLTMGRSSGDKTIDLSEIAAVKRAIPFDRTSFDDFHRSGVDIEFSFDYNYFQLPKEPSQMALESESLKRSHPEEDLVRRRLAEGKYDSARTYVRTMFSAGVRPCKHAEMAYLEALIDMHEHKGGPTISGFGWSWAESVHFRPETEHFSFHDCGVNYEYRGATWKGPYLNSAARLIKRALALRPDEPRFLWLESEILQAQERSVEEMNTLTHLIRVFPCYEAYLRRASFLLNKSSYLLTSNDCKSAHRLKVVSREVESRQILKKLNTARNSQLTARFLANRDALLAASLQPINPYVWEMVGDTRLGSNIGLQLAAQDYERALTSNRNAEQQRQVHYKRAQRLRALKKYSLALQELNEVLRLKMSPTLLLVRADVLGHLGKLEAALTDCDLASAAIVNSSGSYSDREGVVDPLRLMQLRGDLYFYTAKYRLAYREYLRAEALIVRQRQAHRI